MTRRGALVLVGAGWLQVVCAHATQAGERATPRPATVLIVHGVLTRQGPDRHSFWAITDLQGRTWEILEPTPEQVLRFERLQNARIVARLRVVPASLRLGARLIQIEPEPK